MNRNYAFPAALALALHALIFFVGSGKPPPTLPAEPTKVSEPKPPVSPNEVIVLQAAEEFVKKEIKKLLPPGEGDDGGKKDVLNPPSLPNLPHVGPIDFNRGVQDYIPVLPGGDGKKISPNWGRPTGEGDGSGNNIYTPNLLDELPSTRSMKEPVYPGALKASGTTGTVWVEFLVDEYGRVHDVKVVKSTHRGFEEATVEAVSHWKFNPGKHNSLPVRFRMSVPVVFSLSD